MNKKIPKIKDSEFDSLILFPRRPTVVFFSANWSEASERALQIFEAAAEKYQSKAAIYEMDIDENPIIPLAYGIRRIPAVLTFANGKLDESHTGAITEESLNEKIEKITSSGDLYKTIAGFFQKTAARARYRVGLILSELF